MYKLVKQSGSLHPVMTFRADHTFNNIGELLTHLYAMTDETMESVSWLYDMDTIRIGPKIYHNGYEVNYPFNPLDMFSLLHDGKQIEMIAISFEEGGIALAVVAPHGKIYLCFQEEADWANDQLIIKQHTHNPYTVLAEYSPMFGQYKR